MSYERFSTKTSLPLKRWLIFQLRLDKVLPESASVNILLNFLHFDGILTVTDKKMTGLWRYIVGVKKIHM